MGSAEKFLIVQGSSRSSHRKMTSNTTSVSVTETTTKATDATDCFVGRRAPSPRRVTLSVEDRAARSKPAAARGTRSLQRVADAARSVYGASLVQTAADAARPRQRANPAHTVAIPIQAKSRRARLSKR